VFVAFVVCALIPIGIVAVVSFRSVTEQLTSQAFVRLRQAAKTQGLSLYERLLFAEAELVSSCRALLGEPEANGTPLDSERLGTVEIVDGDDGIEELGGTDPITEFDKRRRDEHLGSGRSVVLPLVGVTSPVPVRLARRLRPESVTSKLLVGEVDPGYLWGLDGANSVPADAEYCVFGADGRLVYQSFVGCREAWLEGVRPGPGRDDSVREASFSVPALDGETYVAGYRDLFLQARFGAPDWVIIVCEPLSVVLQPVERWRVLFPATILMALWVVLLLVIAAIRKQLDPIDELREATEKIARRDFDHRVEIRTGDEFEQLAEAFNGMSERLRRQFGALAATSKTHQAILSSLEIGQIVGATIDGLRDCFDGDAISVLVAMPNGTTFDRSSSTATDGAPVETCGIELDPSVRQEIESVPAGAALGADVAMSDVLSSVLGLAGMETAIAIPIVLRQNLAAVLGLGFRRRRRVDAEDLAQLTQIADQFAVALANAGMIAEINDFSFGALEAMARAIDAKSPWTAGHSERVTKLGLAIGTQMELDDLEISRLHRGAMLHDIGKLGIEKTLLDKRGRLDRHEFDIMKSHTTIGERILEPIAAFAEIMSVVTQHHERFDGTGYPLGLVGREIDIKARILAVADVFDAMTSPRPYRDSVAPQEVLDLIISQSGLQFDPDVVDAFVEVIESKGGVEHTEWLDGETSVAGVVEVRPAARRWMRGGL
jgi:putative nucleotidyltransferase with HDIG domain